MTRTARFLFWVLAIGTALASLRFIGLGFETGFPNMAHHFDARMAPLFLHIAVSPLALAMLPFQFWTGLRTRRPALHRWTGRAYALCVLTGGLSGLNLAFHANTGAIAATGFTLLSLLWLTITAIAVHAAWRRDITRHRRWIAYSAAMTFAAATLRIELPLMLIAGLDFTVAYPIVAWSCWTLNLAAAAWWRNRAAHRPARPQHA